MESKLYATGGDQCSTSLQGLRDLHKKCYIILELVMSSVTERARMKNSPILILQAGKIIQKQCPLSLWEYVYADHLRKKNIVTHVISKQ